MKCDRNEPKLNKKKKTNKKKKQIQKKNKTKNCSNQE